MEQESNTTIHDDDSKKMNVGSGAKRLVEIYRVIRKNGLDRKITPQNLRSCIEELGPVFIKFGQLLAIRSEVLPRAYRKALAGLHASCQPLPFEKVMSLLKETYGETLIERTFSFIDPTPLGSASIAQVHRARLATGEEVAIKLRRPGIVKEMKRDLRILLKIMKILRQRLSKALSFDPVASIEELQHLFEEEADFRIEVENLKEFDRRYAGKRGIVSPRPYSDLCRENIVVMTCMDGVPLGQLDRSSAPKGLGENVFAFYLDQVIDQGFFHADPHPGNIFIQENAIGFIDMGMMGRLGPVHRSMLEKLIEGAALGDSSKLLDAILGIVSFEEGSRVDHAGMLADIDGLVLRHSVPGAGSFKFADFATDLISVARRYDLMLPRELTSAVRGIITMEGSIEEHLGKIDMVRIAQNFITKQRTKGSALSTIYAKETTKAVLAYRGGLDFMTHSGDIARLVSRGQMKLNIKLLDSRRIVHSLFRLGGWLCIALLIAGLLISASLVDMGTGDATGSSFWSVPVLERVCAFVLTIVLVIDIMRSKKGNKV